MRIAIVLIISTRVVFLRKGRHFLQLSTKTFGGRKSVGNKGPKTKSSNVRNRLKFVKISRTDLLSTKM